MEIRPFRAVRFNGDAVGDVGSCISPPYDVINPEQQEQLYQKNPCNIVRIIKGKTEPTDNGDENQYTRAAEYLNKWMDEGALRQDESESIYGYVQDFQRGGRSYQRFSFIALAKLEQFGEIVRPHERVLNDPIVDRLNLKKATEAGFGLIFVLYEDKDSIADKIIAAAAKEKALIDFVDEMGVRHRLYTVTGVEDIDSIVEMMQDKSCIIADGHHRYTTALSYLKESTNPAAKYLMLAFANTCNEGLIVLATHRLVANVDDFDLAALLDRLGEDFEIKSYAFDSPQTKTDAKQKMLTGMKDAFDSDKSAFGIYAADDSFYVATLKNKAAMDAVAPDASEAWRSLDVAVLHKLILEKVVGLDEVKVAAGGNVQYVKDTIDAINDSIVAVDEGRKQVAFFMNPPRIEQMQMVADNGERMPQKSTYFFPKVYTGLTINKM